MKFIREERNPTRTFRVIKTFAWFPLEVFDRYDNKVLLWLECYFEEQCLVENKPYTRYGKQSKWDTVRRFI